MNYTVKIIETLAREVTMDGESYADALDKVRRMYKEGQIILSADDFTGVEFTNISDDYVSSCVPDENFERKEKAMTNEIRERVKNRIRSQIEGVVEGYDFSWAVDDAVDSCNYREEIEEAIFDHLSDNIDEYIGSIVEETIDEEVPSLVDAVFEE